MDNLDAHLPCYSCIGTKRVNRLDKGERNYITVSFKIHIMHRSAITLLLKPLTDEVNNIDCLITLAAVKGAIIY